MDQHVKRMLKLIEEDADSFAKKAELYFKKRPELLALVEDFYRMYRSLAERYDHVTGELRRNIPSDLRSQGSTASDVTSEPSYDPRPTRTKSGPRAAGFDVFLPSDRSSSTSTTLDSDSDSEDGDSSSVNNYPGPPEEPETEPRGKPSLEFSSKIQAYEEELRVLRENMRTSEEEVGRLAAELQMYKSRPGFLGESLDVPKSGDEKFHEVEEEAAVLRRAVSGLEEQLRSARKEIPSWKSKVEREKREVARLQDRMTRYKSNLSERDQEIRGLREAISDANKALSEENEQLRSETTRLGKERAYLEDSLKEFDLRCQSLEEEARRARAAKIETEAVFGIRIEELKTELAGRDGLVKELEERHEKLLGVKEELDARVEEMRVHLHALHLQHAELIEDADVARRSEKELESRVEELEREVGRKEEAIVEGAEGKREAIRQLCFSLEHYRTEYIELQRRAVVGHKRPSAMAA